MKQNVRSNLADYRRLKGLTQEELAEQAGIAVRTIQRIETGQVTPQLHTLRALADCLHTVPEKLVARGGPTTDSNQTNTPTHRRLLAAMHVVPLLGIVWPLVNILIPLFFWLLKKQEHPLYNQQGIQILNFQLTMTLIAGSLIGLLILYSLAGLPLLLISYGYAIYVGGVNMLRCAQDQPVHYPLSIPFIKAKRLPANALS